MTNMQKVTRAISKATKQERKVARTAKWFERGMIEAGAVRRVERGTIHTSAAIARFV